MGIHIHAHPRAACRADLGGQLSKEYDGKVKFIKVNVQTAYVGIQIRSMPTFHFYVQGKKEHEFSGADENGSVALIA